VGGHSPLPSVQQPRRGCSTAPADTTIEGITDQQQCLLLSRTGRSPCPAQAQAHHMQRQLKVNGTLMHASRCRVVVHVTQITTAFHLGTYTAFVQHAGQRTIKYSHLYDTRCTRCKHAVARWGRGQHAAALLAPLLTQLLHQSGPPEDGDHRGRGSGWRSAGREACSNPPQQATTSGKAPRNRPPIPHTACCRACVAAAAPTRPHLVLLGGLLLLLLLLGSAASRAAGSRSSAASSRGSTAA
jgi:hypothetical protein